MKIGGILDWTAAILDGTGIDIDEFNVSLGNMIEAREEALLKALKEVVEEIGEKIIEVETQYKREFANVDEGRGMVTGLKISRIFVEALLKEHGR